MVILRCDLLVVEIGDGVAFIDPRQAVGAPEVKQQVRRPQREVFPECPWPTKATFRISLVS
jgi:hypothetical protein